MCPTPNWLSRAMVSVTMGWLMFTNSALVPRGMAIRRWRLSRVIRTSVITTAPLLGIVWEISRPIRAQVEMR